MKNPSPRSRGGKPTRDPDVEEAQVVTSPMMEGAPPAPAVGAESNLEDVPMPTVENVPGSFYRPKPGCSIIDNFEIVLMYLLQLSGNQGPLEPGILRNVSLSAERVSQLSPSAQKHMESIVTSAPQ